MSHGSLSLSKSCFSQNYKSTTAHTPLTHRPYRNMLRPVFACSLSLATTTTTEWQLLLGTGTTQPIKQVLGDALYDVDLSVLDEFATKRRASIMEKADGGATQPFVFSQRDIDAAMQQESLDMFADIDFDFDSTISSSATS